MGALAFFVFFFTLPTASLQSDPLEELIKSLTPTEFRVYIDKSHHFYFNPHEKIDPILHSLTTAPNSPHSHPSTLQVSIIMLEDFKYFQKDTQLIHHHPYVPKLQDFSTAPHPFRVVGIILSRSSTWNILLINAVTSSPFRLNLVRFPSLDPYNDLIFSIRIQNPYVKSAFDAGYAPVILFWNVRFALEALEPTGVIQHLSRRSRQKADERGWTIFDPKSVRDLKTPVRDLQGQTLLATTADQLNQPMNENDVRKLLDTNGRIVFQMMTPEAASMYYLSRKLNATFLICLAHNYYKTSTPGSKSCLIKT
jgi:hypothetical protein